MYGIIQRTTPSEFKVLSENGVLMEVSRVSAERVAGVANGSLVHFEVSQDGDETAEVRKAIIPARLDRERIKTVIARWDQEAKIDKGEFIPIDAYQDVYSGNKTFVLGRKGVGKTAIAKQLLKANGVVGGLYAFSEFPFAEIYKLRNEAFPATKYRQIWSILIVTLALAELNKRSLLPKSSKLGTGLIASIVDILDHPALRLAGEASSLAFGVNAVNITHAILSWFKKGDSKAIEDALNETHRNLIFEYAKLESIPEVVIVFDQIDEEYRERNAEFYPDLIESLFYAANWFRNPRESDGTLVPIRIKPVVLLREDIFDTQFNTNDKAKYLSAIVKPDWNKDKIKQVIHSRLTELVGGDQEFEELWLSLFEPFFMSNGKRTFSSFECFIRFTSRTPRDIIELLKSVCHEVGQSNRDILRCSNALFEKALHAYGEYYYTQVIDGARTQIPEIDAMLQKLRDVSQAITISRESITEVLTPMLFRGSPTEQKQIDDEKARIDKLGDQLINADDAETRQFIKTRIAESKSIITNLTNEKVRLLLGVLWDVCAIGLLFNQRGYRAKYLQTESFSIKPKEQIVFHPALGIALHLDVSVNGLPFEFEGDQFYGGDDKLQKARFSQDRLNSEERELVERELQESTWILKVTQTNPNHCFLMNSDFPNNVYCARAKVPPGLTIHKGDEYEVQVCTADNNGRLSYVVESFCGYAYPRYSQEALEDAEQREKINVELSGSTFSMQIVNIAPQGFGFLKHPDFADNIYASQQFGFSGAKIGDSVEVKVGIKETGKGFRFYAKRALELRSTQVRQSLKPGTRTRNAQ